MPRWLPRTTVSFALLLLSSHVNANTKAVLPTPASIPGLWVGVTVDELYTLRLELRSDRTGVLAVAFRDDEPTLLLISAWKLEGRTFSAWTKQAKLPDLSGHAGNTALSLTFDTNGSRRRVEFRREQDIERRWNRLKSVMRKTEVAVTQAGSCTAPMGADQSD